MEVSSGASGHSLARVVSTGGDVPQARLRETPGLFPTGEGGRATKDGHFETNIAFTLFFDDIGFGKFEEEC